MDNVMHNPALRALSLLPFLLASCVTHLPEEDAPPAPAMNSTEDLEADLKEARRKFEFASAKLEIAQLELEAHQEAHAAALRHAEAGVAMASERLTRHRDVDAPRRLAGEMLDLRAAKDRAQEAVDELKQIEIMYDEQDLDDMTAEFVVSRGRRNAERAEARIALQEAAFKALEERELPAQEASLGLDLQKAEAALATAVRKGEITRRNLQLAIDEATARLEGLEADVEELEEKIAQ